MLVPGGPQLTHLIRFEVRVAAGAFKASWAWMVTAALVPALSSLPGCETSPPRWMVFDSAGFARGTIRTPAGLEILRIGED